MSWYTKISSVRTVKIDYIRDLIKDLSEAEEVSQVDHIQAEQRIKSVLDTIGKGKGDSNKLPNSIKETMKTELEEAYSVVRDSPQNFITIVDGVLLYLDDYLPSLYLKGE